MLTRVGRAWLARPATCGSSLRRPGACCSRPAVVRLDSAPANERSIPPSFPFSRLQFARAHCMAERVRLLRLTPSWNLRNCPTVCLTPLPLSSGGGNPTMGWHHVPHAFRRLLAPTPVSRPAATPKAGTVARATPGSRLPPTAALAQRCNLRNARLRTTRPIRIRSSHVRRPRFSSSAASLGYAHSSSHAPSIVVRM